MFAAPGVANAADSENSIIVSVQDQTNNNGVSEKKPVAGVKVSVSNPSGLAVGEGVTDSAGLATIPVPAKDDYVVTLDIASLPSGVTLIEGTKTVVNIIKDSFTTNSKRVTFFAGSSGESGASLFDRIAQRLVDGIRLGLIIAICSVGLSLIFGTTGLTNFAHGEMVTFGGLIAFWFNVLLGIPLPPIFVSQRHDGVWDVVDGLQRPNSVRRHAAVRRPLPLLARRAGPQTHRLVARAHPQHPGRAGRAGHRARRGRQRRGAGQLLAVRARLRARTDRTRRARCLAPKRRTDALSGASCAPAGRGGGAIIRRSNPPPESPMDSTPPSCVLSATPPPR